MKKKNILSLVLALALVAALAVGGTLAYFTDQDETHNTFVMGKIDMNLDESSSDDPNVPGWTENGLEYKNVVPGDEQTKKARVTVKKGSEDCYVMVNVAFGMPEAFTAQDKAALTDSVKAQIEAGKWEVTKLADGTLRCVYKDGENRIVHALENDVELMLFEKVIIPKEFKNNTAGQTFTIDLKAYAIQSDNLEYAPTIWDENAFEVVE